MMTLNVSQVVSHRNGFRIAQVQGYGDADHASLWSFDDEQVVRDRHWHPRTGQTVFDIGAAFGSYALPALRAGARVVCFSPADFDTQLLEENLRLNPDLAQRCLVVRDGLYSQDGWFDPDHCKAVAGDHVTRPEGPQWLRVRSLDSFLAERPGIVACDWMKLDVEGAELEVLRGAEQCLRRWHPKILVELHQFHDQAMPTKVTQYLAGLGYSVDGPYPHCAVSHACYEVR